MTTAATRWRLLELQRRRRAIEAGIDLLDRKREALLRALTQRRQGARERRRQFGEALAAARASLDAALVEVGEAAARGAALAQPSSTSLSIVDDAVVGVRVPRLVASRAPFRLCYGPGGTSGRLDAAAHRYDELLPGLMALAEEEHAERLLAAGLRRTSRTLNALKAVLLPNVDADIRAVASALEEEEREEAIRWRCMAALSATPMERSSNRSGPPSPPAPPRRRGRPRPSRPTTARCLSG